MSWPGGSATRREAIADRRARFLASGQRRAGAAGSAPRSRRRCAQDPARLRGLLDRDIAAIDDLIAAQLDAVLHHPRLQRLEGSWRGLAWLVDGFDPAARLKTRLLSAAWEELDRDLRAGQPVRPVRPVPPDLRERVRHGRRRAVRPAGDRSRAAPRAGAARAWRRRRRSTTCRSCRRSASIAAAAFVPIVLARVAGAARRRPVRPTSPCRTTWRPRSATMITPAGAQLATREDTRFLCVTMPRVLARPRWRAGSQPARRPPLRGICAERRGIGPGRVAGYAFAAAVGRAQSTHQLARRRPRRQRRPDRRRPGAGPAGRAFRARSRDRCGTARRSTWR